MDSLRARLTKPWQLAGFGFLQAWVLLIALSPSSFSDSAFFLNDSFSASLILSGGLSLCTIAFIVLDAFRSIYRNRAMLVAACCVAGLGSALMLWGSGTAAAVGGIMLANIGSSFLSLWWGKRWATLATDRVALHLSVSSLVSCALFVVVGMLDTVAAVAVISLLPLASGLCLLASANYPERAQPNPSDSLFPSLWKVVVMLAAIPLAYSLVRSFFFKSNLALFGLDANLPMVSFACFSVVTLTLVLRASRHRSIVVLYRVVVTVMSLGFVALLALPEAYRFAAIGAIMLSYTLFDELTWLMHPRITVRIGRRELTFSDGGAYCCAYPPSAEWCLADGCFIRHGSRNRRTWLPARS